MRKKKQASESETKVLSILLKSQDKMTVRQMCEILSAEGIPWITRTVSTFLDRMEEKGLVAHEKIGITNYYYPLVDRTTYKVDAAKNILGIYFDGSFKEMLTAFSNKGELSQEDIDELEKWIGENKK